MAKQKEEPLKDTTKLEDKTGGQDTVAADPKKDESDGLKAVNIPVSASNALSPEAGIMVPAPEESTKEVVQTDAYDPQKTKVVNEIDPDAEESKTVSRDQYNRLKEAFGLILERHVLDVSQVAYYKSLGGL